MERKQFTFFHSFREATALIEDPLERVLAYDTIADYALYGTEPQWDTLPKIVQMAFMLIKPTLDSSNRKAQGGMNGRPFKQTAKIEERYHKDNAKEKEKEIEKEIENEIENEIETEKEVEGNDADFARFWAVYPKKVGKEDAYKAFRQAKQPLDVLLKAIEQQRSSPQWIKDGGTYIPSPARWLSGKRWLDQPTPRPTNQLSAMDLAAIQRMMEHPTPLA